MSLRTLIRKRSYDDSRHLPPGVSEMLKKLLLRMRCCVNGHRERYLAEDGNAGVLNDGTVCRNERGKWIIDPFECLDCGKKTRVWEGPSIIPFACSPYP